MRRAPADCWSFVRKVTPYVLLVVAACAANVARSGHEFPIYPSYYPHAIGIQTLAPDRAAGLLIAGRIQAYIGAEPSFTGPIPDSIRPVVSLGSLVVVRVNPDSALAKDRSVACTLVRTIVTEIAGRRSALTFHPYPVTPFDGDYLYHADLAEAARAEVANASAQSGASAIRSVQVRASSQLAKSLIPESWQAPGPAWDVAIDDVDAANLVASSTKATNGWIAPPWQRSGWFRTALLLNSSIDDDGRADRARADRARLESGAYANAVERVNLERDFVSALAASCRAVVVGYTVKREYVSAEYSAGIENIGFDSIAGLDSPIFIRTAKLKDFPWNGVLALGIDSQPAAAWNPIAGFTDPFGRFMWYAIGDPAVLPSPNGVGWMLNRISDVR